jgi:hypothetical protein
MLSGELRESFVKNRLLIIILACLSMLGAFSTDTYLPSFPSIAAEFQIGLDIVQQTLTVYLLAMAVMTLFHGTLPMPSADDRSFFAALRYILWRRPVPSLQAVFHSCFSAAWSKACPPASEWWSGGQ